jgi:hypothetical protein
MKTKFILTILLFLNFCLLSSQVPQGFNYQAVARDATGNPIINTLLPVRITIQSDSLGETTFWIEEHSSVTTNSFGIFTLVLGKGVKQSGSTVSTFNDIDWTVTPKFIKTEVNYGGWKIMGSSRLWTVPYSMVSGNFIGNLAGDVTGKQGETVVSKVSGTIEKLAVKGAVVSNDSALFEVKNRTGQTVFAVYNEGVRVYIDDGVTKGTKGGFAIGGFGTEKGTSDPLFVVNADSIRAYIKQNPGKGSKGGFAIGGFSTTKGTANDYLLVSPDSIRAYIAPGTGKGSKGGFAIGGFDPIKTATGEEYLRVTRDSTRVYIDDKTKGTKGSFAIGGFSTTKGGNASFFDVATNSEGVINPSQNRVLWYPIKNAFLAGKVLIEKPDSVGVNSFATGFESKAKGQYSQALGYKAIARGDYSTAIGKYAVANKSSSFAFGENAKATGDEGYAFGRGAIADGFRSFALGSAGVDSAGQTTGVAYAKRDYSFVLGQGSQSLGIGAFAFGLADTASGNFSLAMGYKTSAKGPSSTAIGNQTSASTYNSTAIGYHAIASGIGSTAIGYQTVASGSQSVAMGMTTTCSGNWATALGDRTKAIGNFSTAMGAWAYAIGTYSSAMGFTTKAKPYASFVIGQFNDTTCISTTSWNLQDPLFIVGNGTFYTNLKNAFTILKNSNVGINMLNPGQKLDIAGGNGRVESGYNWLTDSDIRFKNNIYTLEKCLEKVLAMRGVSFDLISDSLNVGIKRKNIGFIAQELENVVPEVVITGSDGFKSVAYDKLTAILTEAIKEQHQQIESTKQENQLLKSELDELKALVNNLIANQTSKGGN